MRTERISGRMFVVIAIIAVALGPSVASAQNYPNKPIRIVTAEAGGNGDANARLIAQGISGPLGEPVVVENRTTVAATEAVARASPDGYTLFVGGSGLWVRTLLAKMSWDAVRDFSPITSTTSSPSVLVVHPSVPARSVKELIALAKAKPGELSVASAIVGSASHLGAELFKAMAGVNIVDIPYKGTGAALTDLIGNRVQLMFSSVASVAPNIKSGRLIGLAVTTAKPSALAPGLPTIAASGLPGYEMGSIQGIWAPAKTPGTIINLLNQEIVRLLNGAAVKERLLSMGVEASTSSPQEFAEIIKSDIARLDKVIKDAGIKAD